MPIKYQLTRYKCKFRCGVWHRKEDFVKKHEDKCWKDIKNKTCCTCKYESLLTDSIGGIIPEMDRIIKWRECKHDTESQTLIDKLEELANQHNDLHIPLSNCEFWEQK